MTPDIFDIVALAVAVVISAYLMACEWAKDDNAEANRKNDKGDTSGLNHRQLLAWRLAELFVGLGLCFLVLLWTGSTMWYLLPLAGMAWAVFGSQHVWKLNKLRDKDWRYLSPGNWWDWTWLRSTGFRGRKKCLAAWGKFYNDPDEERRIEWREGVHKAGTRAMKLRWLVFAASIVTYTLLICL